MIVDGVEYEVIWDGRRPVAPPVLAPPTRGDLALANKRRPVIKAHKAAIWALLKTPIAVKAIAERLGLPWRPVGVLVSKAASRGLVVRAAHVSKRILYVRAAAHAEAFTFPPIRRKVQKCRNRRRSTRSGSCVMGSSSTSSTTRSRR